MRIVSVVFVGKQNEQLFFYCDEDQANRSHLQLVSHSCLDIVEEKKNRDVLNANSDLYFGQLLTIEDYSVYGCYTNCHNKIIVVANHTSTEISAMKDFIYSLCAVFTAAIQNPFHSCGQPLDQVGTMKNKVRCLIESHSASAKKLTY